MSSAAQRARTPTLPRLTAHKLPPKDCLINVSEQRPRVMARVKNHCLQVDKTTNGVGKPRLGKMVGPRKTGLPQYAPDCTRRSMPRPDEGCRLVSACRNTRPFGWRGFVRERSDRRWWLGPRRCRDRDMDRRGPHVIYGWSHVPPRGSTDLDPSHVGTRMGGVDVLCVTRVNLGACRWVCDDYAIINPGDTPVEMPWSSAMTEVPCNAHPVPCPNVAPTSRPTAVALPRA